MRELKFTALFTAVLSVNRTGETAGVYRFVYRITYINYSSNTSDTYRLVGRKATVQKPTDNTRRHIAKCIQRQYDTSKKRQLANLVSRQREDDNEENVKFPE